MNGVINNIFLLPIVFLFMQSTKIVMLKSPVRILMKFVAFYKNVDWMNELKVVITDTLYTVINVNMFNYRHNY